jgi:alkylhydroperoxidase family enzyme
MAFIDYISDDDASQELKALYDRHRTDGGGVDNILRIHGPNPPSMEAHFGLYRALMFGKSPLSRRQREMIAVVVAAAIDCHY